MRIAFTSRGRDWDAQIDPRFGRTDYILLYDEENDKLTAQDNRDIHNVGHGAGPKTAEKLFGMQPDVLITGNGPGGNAQNILNRMNIEIHTGASGMTVRQAYQAYKDNKLR